MRNSGHAGPFRFGERSSFRKWRRPLLWGLALLLTVWIALLGWNWPFTREAVVTALERESSRIVRVGSFHGTLFPPGYTAESLVLRKLSTAAYGEDAATVRRMTVIARWSDLLLLRKRVALISIDGLRMRIPPERPARRQSKRRSGDNQLRFAKIGQIKLEDAAFAFPSTPEDSEPFTITLQSITFDEVNRSSSSPFRARILINEPSTLIRSEGQMGPFNWNDPGRSPLSGSFVVEQADLSVLGGIAGTFTGSGRFRGPLRQIACSGILDLPQFRVAGNTHSVPLSATFRADVNGLNGDTKLEQVEIRLDRTLIRSEGAIVADGKRPGKAATLHLSVQQGYVEDFLSLFTHDGRPAMTGQVSMQANVELPPGPPGFLEKVKVAGDFAIQDGRFANQQTQTEVNHLSKSAEGMSKNEEKTDPTVTLSDIRGHVVAHQGTAALSHAILTAPGAQATVSGTCSLIDNRLNLHGLLRTTGKLADTTSGIKTALLKVVAPLWKKKSMTVVPFTISGTTRNPAFRLDLVKKGRS